MLMITTDHDVDRLEVRSAILVTLYYFREYSNLVDFKAHSSIELCCDRPIFNEKAWQRTFCKTS